VLQPGTRGGAQRHAAPATSDHAAGVLATQQRGQRVGGLARGQVVVVGLGPVGRAPHDGAALGAPAAVFDPRATQGLA
jgi:hypothetical protein